MAERRRFDEMVSAEVEAGYGAKRRRPFVTFRVSGERTTVIVGQLRPAEARQIGLDLLSCAQAAEDDAAVIDTLRGESPDVPEVAYALVSNMRKIRGRVLFRPAVDDDHEGEQG